MNTTTSLLLGRLPVPTHKLHASEIGQVSGVRNFCGTPPPAKIGNDYWTTLAEGESRQVSSAGSIEVVAFEKGAMRFYILELEDTARIEGPISYRETGPTGAVKVKKSQRKSAIVSILILAMWVGVLGAIFAAGGIDAFQQGKWAIAAILIGALLLLLGAGVWQVSLYARPHRLLRNSGTLHIVATNPAS